MRCAGREPSPAQVIDERHFEADVQAALDALPPDFRAAVVLCDIEGLSYEEVAATLGIKLGTVRSRIHRGRSQLKAALEHRLRDRLSTGTTGSTLRSRSAGAAGSPESTGPAGDAAVNRGAEAS